jgi:hypothetical protein
MDAMRTWLKWVGGWALSHLLDYVWSHIRPWLLAMAVTIASASYFFLAGAANVWAYTALGFALACFFLILAGIGARLIEWFRPPSLSGLIVSRITVGFDRLLSDGFIEFGLMCFNGTSETLSRPFEARGFIRFRETHLNDSQLLLEAIVALQKHPAQISQISSDAIPPQTEFPVVIRQYFSRETAELLDRSAQDETRQQEFYFADLFVPVCVKSWRRNREGRLPLWDGIRSHRGRFLGRIHQVSLSAEALAVKAAISVG